ncbi:MAG TPA: ATP-grasp domain-containing protein [Thermoguttaceae bacterium]|nr:ATP-grasp domain-containing protein [Thermoguttaceae bacterium]
MDYDNLATGFYASFFDRRHVLQWTHDASHLCRQILSLDADTHLDVIIPGLNDDVALFSQITPFLAHAHIATLLPPTEAIVSRRKDRLPSLLQRLNLNHPQTCVCHNDHEFNVALRIIGCPCIIKGPECGAFPVHSENLFSYFSAYCANNFGYPVLVQEWKVGEEYSVHGVCDALCDVRVLVAVKKIGITDDGETWMSVTVDHEPFRPCVKAFVQALEWTGPFEIDILRDQQKQIHVLDVNPRFPVWIDGLTAHGINTPAIAMCLALGDEPPPFTPPQPGLVLQKDYTDICFELSGLLPELTDMEGPNERLRESLAYRRV